MAAANLPMSVPETGKNEPIDYYDIMVIGRTGIGKSSTCDKLIIATPDADQRERCCGEQHDDGDMIDGKMKMSDLSMWLLSNAGGEERRVEKRLKDLVMFRSLENSHAQVNQMYRNAENPTTGCQVISNDTTKIRVLDVPGFFGENIGGAGGGQTLGERATASGLHIMREILRIQAVVRLNIKRIIYFIPRRGGRERLDTTLMMELQQMVHYFGRSIFDCMVLVATVSPDVFDFLPENIIPFKTESEGKTRRHFLEALYQLSPGDPLPDGKPPLIFISLNDTCEAILEKVQEAEVIGNELRLEFDHRTCVRCGLKAKLIPGENNEKEKKVACYAGDDPTTCILYEESKCHPWIKSKYWKIAKVVGGIAHLVTFHKLGGWWPDFRNPDDEICVECGKMPGEPGCKVIGSRFRLDDDDTIYRVDHSHKEPVAVADRENPGGIAVPLPGGDQEEGRQPLREQPPEDNAVAEDNPKADEHRQHEQQPAEAENAKENADEQLQQVRDVKSGIPMAVDFLTEAMKLADVSFVEHNVLECDYSGIEYTNKKHNFSLRIPEGAIPKGEKIYFEIDIMMHGPFILPKDTRLVSPILWLCPSKENVTFNKPFQVVIPHILHKITEEKAKKYQLGFAKANHRNMSYNNAGDAEYNFQPLTPLECNTMFSSTNEFSFGTATMSHFCYLCITAKNIPELKSDIGYCLTRAERPATARRHEVCFCVSYCLGTCIEVGYIMYLPKHIFDAVHVHVASVEDLYL